MSSGLPRLSFGCEFEFLVAYVPRGDADPHAGHEGLPPLLAVDNGRGRDPTTQVEAHVMATLRAGGARVNEPGRARGLFSRLHAVRGGPGGEPGTDPGPPVRMDGTDGWDVGTDVSVDEYEHVGAYEWAGVEVRSPAFLARDEAHREVGYVLDLLKSRYRLRLNSSAGFHVHVGGGGGAGTADGWIPDAALRRLGAAAWTADPLLSRLHPPWRRVGGYSGSLRYGSLLACQGGAAAAIAAEAAAAAGGSGSGSGNNNNNNNNSSNNNNDNGGGSKPPPSTQPPDKPPGKSTRPINPKRRKLEPFDASVLPAAYRSDLVRQNANWPRIGWVPSAARPRDPGPPHQPGDQDRCTGSLCMGHPATAVREGVATLLGVGVGGAGGGGGVSGMGTEVARLLSSTSPGVRLNYNFVAYQTSRAAMETLNRRTVEFRESGGTLDPGWARAWARVCLGLVDWCRKERPLRYLDVLGRVAAQEDRDQRGDAQTDAERYDVCDFLDDLGLFAEAEWIRQREERDGPPL